MKQTVIKSAILSSVFGAAMILSGSALAQDSSVPKADEIIEALQMPEAPAQGMRMKGGSRGISLQAVTPVEPPSMNFAVEFELGSSNLTHEAMSVLDELGTALSSNDLSEYDFRISGHTDATGPETYNQQLSVQRAQAVETYLWSNHGIDRSRLDTVGRGESDLLDANNPFSPQNRRVEIINLGASGS